MSRYLTTQERVDLAVKAGHQEAVLEHIRMHNNADGLELESLRVTTPQGQFHEFSLLPSYGIAAVDCYLNTFGIPTTTEHSLTFSEKNCHPTMAQLANYAKTAAEDAVVYRSRQRLYRPAELIERLCSQLEYEAIDTNFQILVSCANARALIDCGISVIDDVVAGTKTLKLSNGVEIEMHLDVELADYLQRTYVIVNEGVMSAEYAMDGNTPIGAKLIALLEEEVDRQLKLI